jgi:colanic acid biosynthesis glycosyl transferase WcaI
MRLQTLKILFMIESFPPEISTGRLGFQICKHFQKSKNQVTVLTLIPRPYMIKEPINKKNSFFYSEIHEGLKVIRFGPGFSKVNNFKIRGFEYFYEFFSFFLAGLTSGKTDVIICCSPPLTIALAGFFLGKIKNAPVLVRIGDLHPQELIDLGMIKNNALMFVLETIEKFVYKKSSFLTVLSQGYSKHILSKGADENKIKVLSNWGDIEEETKSKKAGSDSTIGPKKFIVTYAGIISWFQDLETLVDAAKILKLIPDITFLIVGDGPKKQFLVEKCSSQGLTNVSFLPFQSRDEYLGILQDSNVCIVAIKNELTTTTIPSKIFDIMTCERPLLAIVPYGEVTELILHSNCGYWIEPGNSQKLADKIILLNENKKLAQTLGKNGRQYLESHYTLETIGKEHETILNQLVKAKTTNKKRL